MTVSERVTFFREAKQLSVNKLANKAGISQSHLREIELGNKQSTVEYLTYICDALGISLKQFFNDQREYDRLDGLLLRLSPEQREMLADFIESF